MLQKKMWIIPLFLFLLLGGCEIKKTSKIDVTELTIAKIHDAYKKGEYTSEQLVKAYLERIEKYNDTINAVSMVNPKALDIARVLDKEFKKTGTLRPLHGIPVIVKDNFNTEGMPTTAGSLALKDFIPDMDAFVVAKLRMAGAIIIAKSNMAEWAFSPMHTESSTVGTTRNPYNLNYVPAGSSGGTAAAVAANFATVGLGTDTGNSIRGPSSHNALVGFRCTIGLISRNGIVPLYLRNDMGGPMCRTVEDATRVLDVIAGNDFKDPMCRFVRGNTPGNYHQFLNADGLKGIKIGVLRQLSDVDIDPEIESLFEKAIMNMEELGAKVIKDVNIEDFEILRKGQWCDDFRKDIENYLAEFVKSDTLKTLEDIIRIGSTSEYAIETLKYFAENSGREGEDNNPCLDMYKDERRIAFREAIEKEMDKLGLDALVYPTWNNKPARIDYYSEEYKGDNSQIISPHTGQPAFTVPMGFIEGNLPVGIQFLGRVYDEPALVSIAYAYEQGTKHRVPPVLE